MIYRVACIITFIIIIGLITSVARTYDVALSDDRIKSCKEKSGKVVLNLRNQFQSCIIEP